MSTLKGGGTGTVSTSLTCPGHDLNVWKLHLYADVPHPDDPISKKAVKEIEACRRRLEKIIGGVKPKPTGPTLKFPPPQRPI